MSARRPKRELHRVLRLIRAFRLRGTRGGPHRDRLELRLLEGLEEMRMGNPRGRPARVAHLRAAVAASGLEARPWIRWRTS